MPLDNYDRAIIHFLGNHGEATKNKIAECLKISWAKTHEHVNKLFKLNYLVPRKEGETTYWDVNR